MTSITSMTLLLTSTLPSWLERLSPETLLTAFFFLFGLILTLWGQRLMHLWLAVAGFLSGYSIALSLNHQFLKLADGTPLIFACVMGLAFAILFGIAYRLSFFLAGSALGTYLTIFLYHLYVSPANPPYIYTIVLAFLFGSLAAALRKTFVRIATSICGSLFIADATMAVMFHQAPNRILRGNFLAFSPQVLPPMVTLLIVAFSALGIWHQTRKHKKN